jgi:enoyl-CoA hydratase
VETYLDEAIKLAQKVGAMSQAAIRLAKDAVNKSFELSLHEGLNYEKRNFFLLLSTEDQTEGMNAFIEKRKPEWKNR